MGGNGERGGNFGQSVAFIVGGERASGRAPLVGVGHRHRAGPASHRRVLDSPIPGSLTSGPRSAFAG
jgi:hypothetical protein